MAKNKKSNAGNIVLWILCALVVLGIAAIIYTNALQRNSIFKDDLFKDAISTVLGKQPANITESDISAIKYLSVNAAQQDPDNAANTVITLQIGYDEAVTELEKGDEADSEVLSKALSGVILDENIKNFDDLKLFTGLKVLSVNGDLVNLDGISSKDIAYLYVTSGKLEDISKVAEFTALKEVSIGGGNFADVSAFANCKSLTGLFLNGCKVKDISALKNLTALESLDLSSNEELADISALADCKALKALAFDGTAVSDISALNGLENLESVSFAKAKVSDISPLSANAALKTIIANENGISDISAVKELAKLTTVILSNNEIEDISALKGLAELEYCDLSGNKISDVSALAGKEKLTALLLDENEGLTDITPIKELVYSYYKGTGNCYVTLPEELAKKIQEEIAAEAEENADNDDETPADKTADEPQDASTED